MHLYNSMQEKRDVETLEALGLEVFNPNSGTIQEEVAKYKVEFGDGSYMDYFKKLIENSDVFAFRAHIDGKIPSGVGYELLYAKELGKAIVELPSLINSKFMEVGETRQYLQLLGQR